MKIIVGFKTVPDLEKLTDDDWQVTGLEVDTSFVPRLLNSFDESSLETALRIADAARAAGESVTLQAVTIGPAAAAPFLKTLAALKYDKVTRIDDDGFRDNPGDGDPRFSPTLIASLLAAYARREQADLLLLGRQSGVGDNGQTPFITAELLGWPCISEAAEIHSLAPESAAVESSVEPSAAVRVIRRIGGGLLKQIVPFPAIVAMGETQSTYLRIPTLRDRMQFGKRPPEILDAQALLSTYGLEGPGADSSRDPQLVELYTVDRKRDGVLITEGSTQEKAQQLYDTYLKERLT